MSDGIGAAKSFEDVYIYESILCSKQRIKLRKHDINALLKDIGIYVQLFLEVVMFAGKAFLLIKIKAVNLADLVSFSVLTGGQDITNGQDIQIIVLVELGCILSARSVVMGLNRATEIPGI